MSRTCTKLLNGQENKSVILVETYSIKIKSQQQDIFHFFQFFAVIFFPNIKGWQTSIRSTRVLIQSSEGCYNNGYDTIFGKHGQNFIKWHLHCTKVFIITMHTIHQECSFICLRRIACSVFFKTELDPIDRYRYALVFLAFWYSESWKDSTTTSHWYPYLLSGNHGDSFFFFLSSVTEFSYSCEVWRCAQLQTSIRSCGRKILYIYIYKLYILGEI